MKYKSWYKMEFYEYIVIDKTDGQRLVLEKGDSFMLSIDSLLAIKADGHRILYPAVNIASVQYKLKDKYNNKC